MWAPICLPSDPWIRCHGTAAPSKLLQPADQIKLKMNGAVKLIKAGLRRDILPFLKTVPAAVAGAAAAAAARRLKADSGWEINMEGNLFSHALSSAGVPLGNSAYLAASLLEPS